MIEHGKKDDEQTDRDKTDRQTHTDRHTDMPTYTESAKKGEIDGRREKK